MRKRVISLALAMLMVLTVLPGTAAADTAQPGKCGDNLTWTLSGEGVLTISGTGEMYDGSFEDPVGDKSAVKSLVIEQGVTSVGDYAFEGFTALKSAEFPGTLLKIGNHAFDGCTSLESIYYRGSVKQWKGIELDLNSQDNSLSSAMLYCLDATDPFPDIQGWFHDYIISCYLGNVVNGYPDGTFRPDSNVTRAQFIQMLYNMCSRPDAGETSLMFSDSGSINNVYRNAICWGVRNGIIMGYGDGTFRPDENISRAQMATFAYRLLEKLYGAQALGEHDTESSFTDSYQILDCYRTEVNVVASIGIINGYPDGRFGPNDTATRGQAAAIFVRIAMFINASVE